MTRRRLVRSLALCALFLLTTLRTAGLVSQSAANPRMSSKIENAILLLSDQYVLGYLLVPALLILTTYSGAAGSRDLELIRHGNRLRWTIATVIRRFPTIAAIVGVQLGAALAFPGAWTTDWSEQNEQSDSVASIFSHRGWHPGEALLITIALLVVFFIFLVVLIVCLTSNSILSTASFAAPILLSLCVIFVLRGVAGSFPPSLILAYRLVQSGRFLIALTVWLAAFLLILILPGTVRSVARSGPEFVLRWQRAVGFIAVCVVGIVYQGGVVSAQAGTMSDLFIATFYGSDGLPVSITPYTYYIMIQGGFALLMVAALEEDLLARRDLIIIRYGSARRLILSIMKKTLLWAAVLSLFLLTTTLLIGYWWQLAFPQNFLAVPLSFLLLNTCQLLFTALLSVYAATTAQSPTAVLAIIGFVVVASIPTGPISDFFPFGKSSMGRWTPPWNSADSLVLIAWSLALCVFWLSSADLDLVGRLRRRLIL